MSHADEVAAQLDREIGERLHPLAVLAGPTAVAGWEATIDPSRLAAQLCQDADDHLSAETVADVMGALWPVGDPPADWWSTPLGRACARAGGVPDAEAVTQSAAAAMLGVQRGTVATLLSRGSLDGHPDGGVLVSSVLQRLARLS